MLNRTDYYQAIVDKNSEYDGVFYVGVKTTGIFCRPTCTARKPNIENCEFYASAQDALLAGFRPCKRCRPLCPPNESSDIVQQLVAAIEANPEKRWRMRDFRDLHMDDSTARRQFKRRFGMTFIEYARARRMGLAMQHIRRGDSVMDTQLATGYESSSGFRDAFTRIMGTAPAHAEDLHILKSCWLDTPLGPMVAIADDHALFLLEFVERRGLEREIERIRQREQVAIVPGRSAPLNSIEAELAQYFKGELQTFHTPLAEFGTPFQRQVWHMLRQIPYGETRSYAQLATMIGYPAAVRAVARANGSNQLAIIIPCHRVINANGQLGGYAGGLARKDWLLNHERQAASR